MNLAMPGLSLSSWRPVDWGGTPFAKLQASQPMHDLSQHGQIVMKPSLKLFKELKRL